MTHRPFSRPCPSPLAMRRAASVSVRSFARGFSLVELVVVLAITVIVSGLAIVRFSSATTTYRMNLSARRVLADLELAQTRARATSRAVTIRFLDRSDSYRIIGEAPLKAGEVDYRITLAESPYNVSISRVRAADGGTQLAFNGFGSPQQSLEIVIAAGDQQRTITVKPDSGAMLVSNP